MTDFFNTIDRKAPVRVKGASLKLLADSVEKVAPLKLPEI